MKLLNLTIAVWLTASVLVGSASGHIERQHRSKAQTVKTLRHQISWRRSMTWHYQVLAGVSRTPASHAELKTRSVPFLAWIKLKWQHRMVQARRLSTGSRVTNDWATAVNIVQRTWPGTKSWLLSTSSGEGGWGPFVMNTQGSGAGGWLQYMSSTFYSHLGSALKYARAHHLPTIPRSAMTWTSPLGQAFAGGWGCHYNPGAWSRPAC